MSETSDIPEDETGFDRVLTLTVPERNARGRLVRLGPVLDEILSAHDYPAAVKHVLAEGLVLTALMGSLLKEEGSQITVQAQAEGGCVDLMACDFRQGELRGYVRHDAEKLARLGANPTLEALFGTGYLAITMDLAASDERYQGIVPLEGASLSDVCEQYFIKSEQVPTLVRLGIRSEGNSCVAGGLLVQHFPEGEEGRERLHAQEDHPEWQHVAVLAGSTRHDELVDPKLSLEGLVWRLFHEENEVRVHRLGQLSRGCRCTAEYYHAVLARFPEEERAEMRSDDGTVEIDCAFCSKQFRITV
ncbi:MAG: Hsp33 family molecular chaperone HslO [Novosphingobium sp.]|nr:Hsp33 family molecular chaperone HslO [Novosphingobium sp.]